MRVAQIGKLVIPWSQRSTANPKDQYQSFTWPEVIGTESNPKTGLWSVALDRP